MGAPLRALEYFRRSTALATEQGEYAAESLSNEGETLLELDRPQEALTILTRALSQAEESHRVPTIIGAAAALAQVHLRLGDRPLALKLLNHCLEMAEQTGEIPSVAHTLRQIAALRLEEGQAAEAAKGAERAADMARRYGLLEEVAGPHGPRTSPTRAGPSGPGGGRIPRGRRRRRGAA